MYLKPTHIRMSNNNYYFGGNEDQKIKKMDVLIFQFIYHRLKTLASYFLLYHFSCHQTQKFFAFIQKKVQHPPNVYGMLVTSMTHKKNKFLPFADVSRKNLANFGLLILLNSTQPVLNNQGKCFLYFMTKIYSTIFVLLYISLYEKGIIRRN